MLHQYDGERQAARRSASATKKDRLPLLELDVVVMGQDVSVGEEYFGFVVSALGGRVEWHLAAASSEERRDWTTELARFRQPTPDG